ncbi:sugar ABC transporter ATP-binding protein [Paenibacillus caui]|uniref:sugar ABC transporter ATP-binding protein n=1 Tax=Paenibacillus caui TaxID=2873927 RepID=UPI001F296677|nr:sugar ABC transporter ATP-binding protein [Paenibacillus caui]
MLELGGIGQDFGAGPVLHNVSFTVRKGEVHALLGMNGAGKSTLLHIAAGVFSPKEGNVVIDGKPVVFKSPADAAAHGVVFLTQEVDRGLVPQLSVHENLTVALLKKEKAVLFPKKANRLRARQLLAEYGLELDVDKPVRLLSLYEKQMLSLIRAVTNEAKYLLLDEPTASFDPREAERFYATVRKLREQGIGIVFVSHKLHEVMALSDRITVLRGGSAVLEEEASKVTLENIVEKMTNGESAVIRKERKDKAFDEVQFAVNGLRLHRDAKPVSLRIGKGEIVTVFGLLGSGKTSLAETLFGLRRPYQAQVKGTTRRIGSSLQAVKAGLAFIPEERGRQGIWKKEDIRTHLALSFQGWISKRKETDYSRNLISSFAIRPESPEYKVGRLSGGNQQKVAIAKWFAQGRELALFDEPMKGIDVAAKETIFQMIESLAEQGTSVLYLTAEPDEALRISDRIVILSGGEIVEEREAHELTLEELLLAADKEVEFVGND